VVRVVEKKKLRESDVITMSEKKKVAIFCVIYNSYESLKIYLKTIDEAYMRYSSALDLKVVVSDNSTVWIFS